MDAVREAVGRWVDGLPQPKIVFRDAYDAAAAYVIGERVFILYEDGAVRFLTGPCVEAIMGFAEKGRGLSVMTMASTALMLGGYGSLLEPHQPDFFELVMSELGPPQK